MNKVLKLFLIIFLLFPTASFAQTNIKIYFDNQRDSVFYLHQYRGSKTTVVDTAYKKKGKIQFKNKSKFPEGIYLLTNNNNFPLTEILVGEDQRFSLIINDLDYTKPIKVRGCKETANYFKMMAQLGQDGIDMNQFKVKKQDAFINLVIESMQQRDFDHYWDGFPLNDKRILTYPLIDNKLENYFNALPANAEIINHEIDKLIANTGDCVEVRDYLIWYFYRKYYSPDYMNLDDIYIHLVDDYFMKLDMENVSDRVKMMMAERANYLENLKIGKKIPEIGNLHSIENQYVVVFFYDKDCNKCAKERKTLDEIQKRHPEMTVFPVEINSTGIENLQSIYDIQTTPTIYVLDNQKKIIAKRIKAEDVERVLNMDRHE